MAIVMVSIILAASLFTPLKAFWTVCDFTYILILVSVAGKQALSHGVGAFNKAASRAYEQLSTQEKEKLKETAENYDGNEVTSRDIEKRAAVIFKNIRTQV